MDLHLPTKPEGYCIPHVHVQPTRCDICEKEHGEDIGWESSLHEPHPYRTEVLFCPDNEKCQKIAKKSFIYYAISNGWIPFLWIFSNITDLLKCEFLIPRSSGERTRASISNEAYAIAIPSSNNLSLQVSWRKNVNNVNEVWVKSAPFLDILKLNPDSEELIALARGLFDSEHMPVEATKFLQDNNLLAEIREWLDEKNSAEGMVRLSTLT